MLCLSHVSLIDSLNRVTMGSYVSYDSYPDIHSRHLTHISQLQLFIFKTLFSLGISYDISSSESDSSDSSSESFNILSALLMIHSYLHQS